MLYSVSFLNVWTRMKKKEATDIEFRYGRKKTAGMKNIRIFEKPYLREYKLCFYIQTGRSSNKSRTSALIVSPAAGLD